MITQVLYCPYCQGTDMVRHGTTPEGKQRFRCRACPDRGRTFLLEYTYAGQSPAVKQQIVDMAMNASGIRDTARVLHVSPTTVIKNSAQFLAVCRRSKWSTHVTNSPFLALRAMAGSSAACKISSACSNALYCRKFRRN